MAKRKNLYLEHRASVVTLSGEGYSGCAMTRKLKISVHGVQVILKKAAETGNVKDRKRSGRPPSQLEKIAFPIAFLFLIEEQLQET